MFIDRIFVKRAARLAVLLAAVAAVGYGACAQAEPLPTPEAVKARTAELRAEHKLLCDANPVCREKRDNKAAAAARRRLAKLEAEVQALRQTGPQSGPTH